MLMPLAVTLWYLGMNVVPALMLQADAGNWFGEAGWALRQRITLVFGMLMLMLLLAFCIDLRVRHGKDYAFWLYLFGLMTFWGALSSMGSGALSGKLVYLALNFALVLGDLSRNLFKDSFAFVALLTLLGFALIGAGVWWSKHEASLSARLRNFLPQDLRELLEARTG